MEHCGFLTFLARSFARSFIFVYDDLDSISRFAWLSASLCLIDCWTDDFGSYAACM